MIYFLDADFLIRAKNEHFQIDRVPEFWDWLVQNGRAGKIKIPLPIYEEIVRREDPLKDWLSSNKEILRIEDPNALVLVPEILALYGDDLTEDELETIGSDPFLVAYAKHHRGAVVTREASRPSSSRANRRLPDVCREARVRVVREAQLIQELDFRTQGARR
ncbi:MAG: DUF4411 family protein [Alphaproteobacteria bacterium]